MGRAATLAVLILGLWLMGPVVPDFQDALGQYKLAFHQTHHLLLIENDTTCFYTSTANASETYVHFDNFLLDCKDAFELRALYQLNKNIGLQQQNLNWARDTFFDLLANFKCHNKTIYQLNLIWWREPDSTTDWSTMCHLDKHDTWLEGLFPGFFPTTTTTSTATTTATTSTVDPLTNRPTTTDDLDWLYLFTTRPTATDVSDRFDLSPNRPTTTDALDWLFVTDEEE